MGQAEAGRITMKARWISLAATAVLLFPALSIAGATDSAPRPLALHLDATMCADVSDGERAEWNGTRLESIRYRPRARYHERDHDWGGSRARGFSQIHAGFFDP